jgi:hypothetical protein
MRNLRLGKVIAPAWIAGEGRDGRVSNAGRQMEAVWGPWPWEWASPGLTWNSSLASPNPSLPDWPLTEPGSSSLNRTAFHAVVFHAKPHTHTITCRHPHTHTVTQTHMHTLTYLLLLSPFHITNMHTGLLTHSHILIPKHTHTCIHIHTLLHPHACTHTNTFA